MTYFFPDSTVASALTLLAMGAVLVGTAVLMTRRRAAKGAPRSLGTPEAPA